MTKHLQTGKKACFSDTAFEKGKQYLHGSKADDPLGYLTDKKYIINIPS